MIDEEAQEIRLREEFGQTLRNPSSNAPKFDTKVTRVRVVLPAYNEQDGLEELIERIVQTLGETRWTFDILVVDDGSSDRTVSVVRKLQEFYPIKLVCHEVNKGLGAAITTCLTRGIEGLDPDDIVIAMDADNTHPPQLIAQMVPMIREGYDIRPYNELFVWRCDIDLVGKWTSQ